jgi:protein-S-isoprenylcysteine O-methyltransferase Ste14
MIAPLWLILGLVLIVGGAALHEQARSEIQHLVGPRDFGLIKRPTRYKTDGVYRLRHPAYLGAICIIAGAGMLAFASLRGAALVIPALPFYSARLHAEERLRDGVRASVEG